MPDPIALGIDLGGSSIKWGLVARNGTVLREATVPLSSRTPDVVVSTMAAIVSDALRQPDVDLVGVGVGSPGLIDATRSIIRTSPNFPEWENVYLAEQVRAASKSPVPIILENDANLLVYSETRWGGAVGMEHVVVLTLGTGVGGGVLTHGQILRGVNGGGAELGHIPLNLDGPPCGTRVKGSFEAYCNIDGVMREARELYQPLDPPATPDALSQAASAGDERAVEVWRRVGSHLGAGVAAYINIFNPEAVLVGGGISGAWEHLEGPARLTARARCYAANWQDCRFDRATLKEKSGLLGAAAMAFDAAGVSTTTAS